MDRFFEGKCRVAPAAFGQVEPELQTGTPEHFRNTLPEGGSCSQDQD